LSNTTAIKSERTNNRKEVTATKPKNIFEATESYFVSPQPLRQNISSNKTCNNQNTVSKRKATLSLMGKKIELKSYNILWKPACALRSSIAAGREFIARQAPELKPIEKLKYKITTKSPTEFRPPEPLLIVNRSRR